MRRSIAFLFAVASAAFAQNQVVRPPIAQYWVSVETASGMATPGTGAMGSVVPGMMGGAAQGGRRILLQLGSQQAPAGPPRADHVIPAGMNMGPALPLLTPERAPAPRGERGEPGGMEQPKGGMLIYWGCGEGVRPGQPVVIDYAKLAQGQAPSMAARRVSAPAAPAPGRNRTYGDWPNVEDAKQVPDSASLRGDHTVKGSYSPEIRFSLGEGQDFMDRVALASAPRGAGAASVSWNAVPAATGYFATVFGAAERDEVVFWSSSEVQEMGGMLMDYVPPSEVARLVREKVVLAPSTTECTVPAEVVKKSGGSPFLNFIAYGPEANFAQPPRPGDPKKPWDLVWTAKVRFKSTASLILGESSRPERATRPQAEREAPPPPAAAPDPVEQGIRTLRGIFGR